MHKDTPRAYRVLYSIVGSKRNNIIHLHIASKEKNMPEDVTQLFIVLYLYSLSDVDASLY